MPSVLATNGKAVRRPKSEEKSHSGMAKRQAAVQSQAGFTVKVPLRIKSRLRQYLNHSEPWGLPVGAPAAGRA